MPLDELNDQLARTTTRRTVVKTGAKFAYAAPLVAATMKLSTGGAGAVSGAPCPNPAPSSTFGLTCEVTPTCTGEGTILSGLCLNGNGQPVSASINVNTCKPQGYVVTNCDGVLVCGDHC